MSIQEETTEKTISFTIKTSKMTADVLKKAMTAYLNHCKNKSNCKTPKVKTGKMSIKELVGQNQGVTNIEITDKNIKSFERIARKYNVDFALKKDNTQSPPKYLVFFKARDTDVIMQAFKEYTNKTLNKKKQRPSLIKQLMKNIKRANQKREHSPEQKQLPGRQQLFLPPAKNEERER